MDWEGILTNAVRAAIGREALVFALLAMGLNMHFGYTGLLNFGQVGFMLLGAYGVATTVATFGASLWLGLLLSVLLAVVFALFLGIPTLRLRADYLAIVTIAAGEILRFIARSPSMSGITRGSFGLQAFADEFYAINPLPAGSYGIGRVSFGANDAWLLLVGWSIVAFSFLIVSLLVRSPWGRVIKSIREDEDAARSLGKNVYAYKMQSLVLGGVIGALGGWLNAVGIQSVQPDSFSTAITFFAYVALIAGGTATLLGAIAGSMIFWAILSLTEGILRGAIGAGFIPTTIMDGNQVGQVRFMLVGLSLMLLMIFRPQGVFGDKRELLLDAR
jgi:branched-chain amino acid transport system permease protein